MIINSPRVKTIAGSEKTTRIGFIKTLIAASISPAIIISRNLFSVVISLLKKPDAIHSPKLQTIQRVINR